MIAAIISILIGVGIGVFLVRYGIGLGTRIIEQVREDLPILGGGGVTTDQVNTDGTTDEDEELD